MDCLIFRLAAIEDAGLVQAIRARAYIPAYTAVIGVAPKRAFEDYRPRNERGEVWMAALGTEPVGILVMEDAPNHMLIYSVAVEPSHQGKDWQRPSSAKRSGSLAAKGSRSCDFTPTRKCERIYGCTQTAGSPSPDVALIQAGQENSWWT